jgi:alpha-N-arabinofuranosidase
MEMYNVHQDAKLLPLTIKTNDYQMGEEKLPAVSVSASLDKNNIAHISLVNIDSRKEQEVTVDLRGMKASAVSGRILSSPKLQDHNTFENAEKIKPSAFKGAALTGTTLKLKLPPFSVVVLEVK